MDITPAARLKANREITGRQHDEAADGKPVRKDDLVCSINPKRGETGDGVRDDIHPPPFPMDPSALSRKHHDKESRHADQTGGAVRPAEPGQIEIEKSTDEACFREPGQSQ